MAQTSKLVKDLHLSYVCVILFKLELVVLNFYFKAEILIPKFDENG